jgi:drug/metabolite transporter (DMT)-like permease
LRIPRPPNTTQVAWHGDLSTADVNLLRFGSAGVALALGVLLRDLAAPATAAAPPLADDDDAPADCAPAEEAPGGGAATSAGAPRAEASPADASWFGRMTPAGMARNDWTAVASGVVFVTVLNPLIMTWVMFELPLAMAVTLGSLSPVWALPIAKAHGEAVSQAACAGAALACAGVVMLAV